MTRFARGGPANKKKPHEATSWKNMVQSHENDQHRHGSKRACEGVAHSSNVKAKVNPKKKAKRMKPKLLGNVGLDNRKTDPSNQEDALSFLTASSDTMGGLAAELEKVKDPKSKEMCKGEVVVKQKVKKERQKPTKTGCGHEKVTINKGKLLHTELTKHLTDLKRDRVLDEIESKEVEELIKKDQRREKRRLNRKDKRTEGRICYNCRQAGHTVEDCPEKSVQQHSSGICFKCGSTEHSMTKCKLKLPAGRCPYAKCFICGEQGHLSSQCPDNPRGLYPNGGCCGTCGSVEHFKKDCPELQKQQGFTNISVERMTSSFDNVEKDPYLEQKSKVRDKKPKIVKF